MYLTYRTLLFCIVLISTSPAIAQTPAYRYFDKNVNPSTAADCFFYELESGDSVKTFYCSNDAIRSVVPYKDGVRQGTAYHYYQNSAIRSKVNYNKYQPEGLSEEWYRNGEKKSEEFYDEKNDQKLLNYWDSLGNQTVRDGSGFCTMIDEHDDGEVIAGTGKIVNGKRDSVWLGYRNQLRYYEEQYKAGELISGVSFDAEGNTYKYTKIEQSAAPKGGMEGLYSLVGKNIKYPADARRRRIQGRVFIEFVIEKDGTLSGVKCIKGIGGGCDEEGERVVRLSSKWIPGLQRGQHVRQKMVLPIMFKLS
jgi:TonB family protein